MTSELEKKVFQRYQDGKKIEQIAHEIGIAEAYIRQIILKKMKSS